MRNFSSIVSLIALVVAAAALYYALNPPAPDMSGYAAADHTHDLSGYAPADHTHADLAPVDHTHPELAPAAEPPAQ